MRLHGKGHAPAPCDGLRLSEETDVAVMPPVLVNPAEGWFLSICNEGLASSPDIP